MNPGFLLLLPMFQNMACVKHFLIETQDSQTVEENASQRLYKEFSAEGDAKIVNQVGEGAKNGTFQMRIICILKRWLIMPAFCMTALYPIEICK